MRSRIPFTSTRSILKMLSVSFCVRLKSDASSEGIEKVNSSSLGETMRSKGFENPLPNFSVNFSDVPDVPNLVNDIEASPADSVDYLKEIYGPWLVLTEDLQGELFFDHDNFVYYRPANGLGYGIGKVNVIESLAGVGSAFDLKLEFYHFDQKQMTCPLFGATLDVTGLIKRVKSKSADYETMSLVGEWRKDESKQVPSSFTGTSVVGDSNSTDSIKRGQFNAAKLNPWDPHSAKKPWIPNQQLMDTFQQVFPQPLNLTSHIKRSENKFHVIQSHFNVSHLDLTKYAIGSVPNLYYIPDYISEDEEAQILMQIKNTPGELKSKIKKRTVQEWGCSMCDECKQSFVSDANMPPWVQQCTDMLTYDGIFTPSTFPNSVRIHEYESGEGIGPHCDGPIYVPVVAVLSLAATSVMSFYPKREPYKDQPMEHYNDTFRFGEGDIGKEKPIQSAVLEPRSLLVFCGDAYYYNPHGISDKEVDDLSFEEAGEVINRKFLRNKDISKVVRQFRVSITTRNLLTRCNHQPSRAEYNMKRAWHIYNHKPLPEPLITEPNISHIQPLPKTVGKPLQQEAADHPDVVNGLSRLESNLNLILKKQDELQKSVDSMQMLIAKSIADGVVFQNSASGILNHLSSVMLNLETKIEDLSEDISAKKKEESGKEK